MSPPARVTLASLVVVFEELKLGTVLSELARRLWPEHPAPLISEVPGQVLSVVYPDRQIQCQFANNRVEVNDSRGVEPGTEPFPLICANAVQAAVEASGEKITAFGYNFDLSFPLDETTPKEFLTDRLFHNPERLADAFGAQLNDLGVIAAMTRDDCKIQLLVERSPLQGNYLRVYANHHFEKRRPPSDSSVFAEAFRGEYENLQSAVGRFWS